MSMMVNRVSGVSFKANNNPLPEDFLSRPGAYSNPVQDAPAQQPKKKHSVLKAIVGTLIAAAVVAGSLYAAHKYAPETFNAAKKFADFKEMDFLPKWKGYITTAIGKGGEAIEKAATSAGKTCSEWWGKLFNRTETVATDTAETLTEAAAEAPAVAS